MRPVVRVEVAYQEISEGGAGAEAGDGATIVATEVGIVISISETGAIQPIETNGAENENATGVTEIVKAFGAGAHLLEEDRLLEGISVIPEMHR